VRFTLSALVPLVLLANLGCGNEAPAAPDSKGHSGTSGTSGTAGSTSGAGTAATAGTTGASGGQGGAVAAGGNSGAGSGTGGGGGAGAGGNGTGGISTGGNGTGGISTGGVGAGGTASSDTPPSRPLAVKATAGRHEHSFLPSAADAEVSFNDKTQLAIFDNRAPKLVGKLVLPFGGAGETAGSLGGQGEFCARRGFHVLAIAAFQDYDIVLGDPDFYGDARRQVFDGITHTTKGEFANVKMVAADGVARRTQKALAYLHGKYPDEDWGYYLQPDGGVRWSDVIFTGMSHGASSAARFAMLVRAWRAVSVSGPRDNTCMSLNQDNCGGVVAKWFDEEPATPIERFFAITGKTDAQHTQHLYAMEHMGYVGKAVAVRGAAPPYGGSHRFIADGGHQEFCGQAAYDDACNLAFDVPLENRAGVR
jgi:hypothetical protein